MQWWLWEIFVITKLKIPNGRPSEKQLNDLHARFRAALALLKSEDSEVRLPLIVEFSGSPKSGKSSIINILVHLFKRLGADVAAPAEGASLRTPPGLRDDWLSFNAWSGCYALQNILIDCHENPPYQLVILDRGLFDVAGWMEFLFHAQQRITEQERDAITGFFNLDAWMRRENIVFLFTADHETSLARERHSKLIDEAGSVMNKDTLKQLQDAYQTAAQSFDGGTAPKVFHVDTSDIGASRVDFQQVAYVVADAVTKLIEEVSAQMLLVTKPATFEMFNRKQKDVEDTIRTILQDGKPQFLGREQSEKSRDVQQIVSYALLENPEGRYFFARRRSDARRVDLQKRGTLLVGGHTEQRDWDPNDPGSIFQRCLRRELDEELIGISIDRIDPIGFINDTRNAMGRQHLAFIHKVKVGGKPLIRRQALDVEFGRGSIEWLTRDEIADQMEILDPWSQLVASGLFNLSLPVDSQIPLF